MELNRDVELAAQNILDKNCVALKAGTEHEGNSRREVAYLKLLADYINVPLWVKVGGCEALADINAFEKMGIRHFIAPMVESEYASRKFIDICQERGFYLCMNVETMDCLQKIRFNRLDIKPYDRINVGRSDFYASLKVYNEIEHLEAIVSMADIYSLIRKKLDNEKINYRGKSGQTKISFGGGLNTKDWDIACNLYDSYCTRHVMFDDPNKLTAKEQIKAALEFEIAFYKDQSHRADMVNMLRERL